MRHLGIAGVIAESFSPGFWRGEISMGFPLVPTPGILKIVQRWDEVEVDWAGGKVVNHTRDISLPFETLSLADKRMLECEGLVQCFVLFGT